MQHYVENKPVIKKKENISLDIDTSNDVIYSSVVYFGNPPQKIRALFDTGSAATWVASSKLASLFGDKHYYYNMS